MIVKLGAVAGALLLAAPCQPQNARKSVVSVSSSFRNSQPSFDEGLSSQFCTSDTICVEDQVKLSPEIPVTGVLALGTCEEVQFPPMTFHGVAIVGSEL